MKIIGRLLSWLWQAWPVLIPLILVAVHAYLSQHFPSSPVAIHKTISLTFQILGGLLVLYSIDSNIWVIKKSGILGMTVGWFKSFPFIKRKESVTVKPASVSATGHAGNVRISVEPKTIEEKVQHLQKQIEWIKEDLATQIKALDESIRNVGRNTTERIVVLKRQMGQLETNVEQVSVGGVKIQAFGVLLLLHGSVAGHLA